MFQPKKIFFLQHLKISGVCSDKNLRKEKNMSEYLMIVMNVFIVFGTIGFVIKTIADSRIRSKAIEKGIVNDDLKNLFERAGDQFLTGLNAIKWGMVLMGIGIAIVVGRFFPYEYADEATFGLAFILAGLAFIIYYTIYKNAESQK